MTTMSVKPEDVRFTQHSIANHFSGDYASLRLDHAVDMILHGSLDPHTFPPIQVVKYRDLLWSVDNRRLWVLRKAKVKVIEVHVQDLSSFGKFKNFRGNLDHHPDVFYEMSKSHFFPKVRGPCRQFEGSRKEDDDGQFRQGKDGGLLQVKNQEARDVGGVSMTAVVAGAAIGGVIAALLEGSCKGDCGAAGGGVIAALLEDDYGQFRQGKYGGLLQVKNQEVQDVSMTGVVGGAAIGGVIAALLSRWRNKAPGGGRRAS